MNRRVVFHPEAEEELHRATSYYEAESPGIGQALLEDIELAIAQISQYRERFRGQAMPGVVTAFSRFCNPADSVAPRSQSVAQVYSSRLVRPAYVAPPQFYMGLFPQIVEVR